MRLATRADLPTLGQVALRTLRAAYPDKADRITLDTLRGFAEQFDRSACVLACTDDASGFILGERFDVGHWQAVWIMPFDMPATVTRPLLAFTLRREHQLRPFLASTECMGRLTSASAIERATADAMQTMFGTSRRDVTDAAGNVVAVEVFITAGQLAQKLGVVL